MGSNCFETPFVIGYIRVPLPPARTIPFIDFFGCRAVSLDSFDLVNRSPSSGTHSEVRLTATCAAKNYIKYGTP